MKSSLKFCVIAASEFDLYVAEPRACEWDIAAGHALVVHSGGAVTDFEGNEIYYGKPEFKNTSIIIKNKKLSNGWTGKNNLNNNSLCINIWIVSVCFC